MKALQKPLFDIYALSLPHGHNFGRVAPVEVWQTEDGNTCGILTQDFDTGHFGVLIMRRRIDHVWTIIERTIGFGSRDFCRFRLDALLVEGQPPEPLPRNTAPRPALYDLGNRTPSEIFTFLFKPFHRVSAWTCNQLYLALPNPDQNWASDFQTGNFHTRLWELLLLASFREQELLVTQPHPSPDFRIENGRGGVAWVEAVTANPAVPYEHVDATPTPQPEDPKETFLGTAAVRFAKTIGNKLQRRYDELTHVVGEPFALALADFHAASSMVWTRQALLGYLYGLYVETRDVPELKSAAVLLEDSGFPAGIFRDDKHSELSAIIFTNACAISKFNRVPISGGAIAPDFRFVRIGNFFDRAPGAIKGIPFSLDITSLEYKKLWPQGYEPWGAELEVFHNAYARNPLPRELLPEATHWFSLGDEMICEAHYQTSILSSLTLVLNRTDPIPTAEALFSSED